MAKPIVTTQPEFFRAQAATMQEQGQATVRDNVRDRCLRAADAWEAMAARAHRSDIFRAKQAAEKDAAAAAVAE